MTTHPTIPGKFLIIIAIKCVAGCAYRIRYSSMPPPNHKLPLDLDINETVKELTVGDKGYVLVPGVFTKEEVDMARFVSSMVSLYSIQ